MDTQITIDSVPQGQLKLSESDAEFVVKYILECEKKGREDRKKYEADWKECDRLYQCVPHEIESEELDWQSNIVLPWAYDSAESWHAHLHSTMVPKRDEIFTVSGRTEEDHPGAEAMQQYMEYKLDQARFQEFFGKVLRQLSRQNHSAIKLKWRTDKQMMHRWEEFEEIDPASGELRMVKRKTSNEQIVYNGLAFDVIQLDDFVFWPIWGDISKTTRIHRTYRYLEDLKIEAEEGTIPYDKAVLAKIEDDSEYKLDADKPAAETECKRKFQGLKIKEAWIHRLKMPDGKIYKNVIATVANDKHLIRFQKAPDEMGKDPFVWLPLRPDGDCLYGYGLNSKGIGILNKASDLFNSKMDEIMLRIHPPTGYWEDTIFNPYSVINRPGAFFEMSRDFFEMGGPRPLLQDFTPVQIAFQEVAELKVEFETVTVPKVVKGLIETQRPSTATEQNLAQSNASGKMHIDAFHINENLLKPALVNVYSMLYQKINEDPEIRLEMARLVVDAVSVIDVDPQTGQPLEQPVKVQKSPDQLMQEMPEFLPLPEIDIQVVGYQNQVRRQEQQIAGQQFVAGLVQTPAAAYLKWDSIAEVGAELADLDKDRLIMNQDERKRADEANQQAAQEEKDLLIMQEKAKLDLQAQKQQQDYEIKLQELELKKLDLQLKYEFEAKKQELEQERNALVAEKQSTDATLRGAEIDSKRESDANRKPAK